ncbi:MAG TPA: hypothetical protein VN112_12420 [Ensifer sp.]|nr:hypothetical protein [Ensifer sp.]
MTRITSNVPLAAAAAILLALAPTLAGAVDPFAASPSGEPKLKLPGINNFSPSVEGPSVPKDARNVRCDAKLTADGQAMQNGISWHVFSAIPGQDGKLQLIAASDGGSHTFHLAPGDYFLNAAFGRATATKRFTVPASGDVANQELVLDAGGIVLHAVSGSDTKIPDKDLKFSIYTNDVQDDGERGLVMQDVAPNTIVRLNSGTYHVVSTYGSLNAIIRADIQVAAGKLTQATIQHRAARVTFKLVSSAGGEAIADTAWSILTASGDIIAENVGAFATMVLSEGNYTAVARNKDKIYQRDFQVKAGRNSDVEVLLGRDDANQSQIPQSATGAAGEMTSPD